MFIIYSRFRYWSRGLYSKVLGILATIKVGNEFLRVSFKKYF